MNFKADALLMVIYRLLGLFTIIFWIGAGACLLLGMVTLFQVTSNNLDSTLITAGTIIYLVGFGVNAFVANFLGDVKASMLKESNK